MRSFESMKAPRMLRNASGLLRSCASQDGNGSSRGLPSRITTLLSVDGTRLSSHRGVVTYIVPEVSCSTPAKGALA